MSHKVLILDDEPKMGKILQRILQREGYEVEFEVDPREALKRVKEDGYQLLLTDLKMPRMSGIDVLKEAKRLSPDLEVIMMTAFATVETAIESMKQGAVDYLIKPFANEELKMLVRRVLDTRQLKEENTRLKDELDDRADFERIVAVSKQMRDVVARVRKVAATNATVLLRGPSGSGKEVMASALHRNSPRRNMAFIKLNCGALPESLLESELFGHARGSFTGAIAARKGLFEAADGGTIFLDEIGEITPALQVKLLRVLQEGEFQRVGESQSRRVNARVIAATNRSLEEAIEKGEFRSDLFFRLNVVPIHIPPLCERREDIPALIDFFLVKYQKESRHNKTFSPEAFDAMVHYDWPGNVRELENAVEHSCVMSESDMLRVEDLPVALQTFRRKTDDSAPPVVFDHLTLEEVEKRCILSALNKTNFNHTRAAKLLGVTRRTLGYRIQKYGIVNPKAKVGVDGGVDGGDDAEFEDEMMDEDSDGGLEDDETGGGDGDGLDEKV